MLEKKIDISSDARMAGHSFAERACLLFVFGHEGKKEHNYIGPKYCTKERRLIRIIF
ncbi:hypothetical protein ABES80_01910 [Bacillus gobiensis]|uniref:hypothetical protein n=1 Tax=Bacillus gobiensis TaxID=1441095 RepID=UPI003D1BE767